MRRVMEAATTRSPQSNRGSDDALTSVEPRQRRRAHLSRTRRLSTLRCFRIFLCRFSLFSANRVPPPWEWEFTVLRTNVSFLSLGEPSNRFRCISGRAQETG